MSKENLQDYNALIEFLIQLKSSGNSWINRKEIAIWSAVVLYFVLIISVLKLFDDSSIYIPLYLYIPVAILIWYFILLFVRMQFGSLAHEFAVGQTINIWIFKLIKNKGIPEDFNFTIKDDDTLPKSIRDDVDVKFKQILRLEIFQMRFYQKPLLPFRYLISKECRKFFSNFEIEESITYNLITLVTIFHIVYYYFVMDC